MSPFVIFTLPRCRSYWLSLYLSYRDWTCTHEEARHLRTPADIETWLTLPMTGTVETSAAPWWRTLQRLAPSTRVVVVRRPVQDVVRSLLALGINYDVPLLVAEMYRLDAKLVQIARRWPGALSVTFAELATEATCAAVFEHCLPYRHDPAWWSQVSSVNLQVNLAAMTRYCQAYRPQLERLASTLAQQTRAAMAARQVVSTDGMTIAAETFRQFYQDGQHLFRQHLVEVGEAPDDAGTKNIPLLEALDDLGALQVMTARANGRMFGYLVTVLSPTIEHTTRMSSVHTFFYASPDAPGLGMKLQRSALAALKSRGINELFLRAGPRGSGPRMGTIYRRLGAQPDGELYRLNIQAEA